LRRGDAKYIAAPAPELYDLAADPGETENRLTGRRREAAALAERLAAIEGLGPSGGDIGPAAVPAVDEETRARLASLGYAAPSRRGAAGAAGDRAAADPKDRVALFRAFEEAHWARGEGRLGEAVARLEELVVADPDNPVFRSELAAALREGGDREQAVALYRQAVAAAPDDPGGWYDLAVTLNESGATAEALAAVAEALARDPGRPESHNARGVALAAAGRAEEARVAFARAVELDPRNARAYNNLGNALRDLGRGGEAAAAYRRAAEIDPRYPDPLNGLGTLEVAADRPAAAVPWFDRALALDPTRHEVRLNRAIALELAGDPAGAAAGYRDFLAAAAEVAGLAEQRQVARRLLDRLQADRSDHERG
jgi:Flp pilus assembly protein TadD